ncbi:MYXO-CTERM sorting domain-containing protein [Nannocystaceae bacterium ST9]
MLVTLVGLPSTANATLVHCFDEFGECEASNDSFDLISCSCVGDTTGEGTGGEEWASFGEDELLEVCLAHLESLCHGSSDGEGTMDGTGDDGQPGTDEGGEGGEGCDGTATAADSGEAESDDGEGTGDGGEGTGDDGGEGTGDGGEGTGGEGLPADEDTKGWGCSIGEGEGTGTIAALSLLGLLGLRRRRAARV